MMTALSPPSSCSITNGRVCSSHIQWENRQRHYALHKLPLLLRAAPPPSETCLKAPEEKETASEKHKNNPLVTPEVMFTLSQYTKIYQRILFYWNPGKILRMRKRLVPGPYLSPSVPARVKGPGYEASANPT